MFITMAVHHPKPEHTDDFLAFMKTIERGMEGTPGLISIESFRDVDADRLVAIGRWESAEAAAAGVQRLLSIGGRDPEWSQSPDELFRLALA
jgi:heme-degrading monooxygenase HmoA